MSAAEWPVEGVEQTEGLDCESASDPSHRMIQLTRAGKPDDTRNRPRIVMLLCIN